MHHKGKGNNPLRVRLANWVYVIWGKLLRAPAPAGLDLPTMEGSNMGASEEGG